jgi:hypothetical protein
LKTPLRLKIARALQTEPSLVSNTFAAAFLSTTLFLPHAIEPRACVHRPPFGLQHWLNGWRESVDAPITVK